LYYPPNFYFFHFFISSYYNLFLLVGFVFKIMISTQSFSFSVPFKTDYAGMGRCRNCDTAITSNTPANQFQRLRLIQNTVRVPSSIYTMNLGALNAYVRPTAATYNVGWSQMSDRPLPSVGTAVVPTVSNISKYTRRTATGVRPGAQSPGGVGCDIKHNSYDRYLNRMKAKGPLRQQTVPDNFGQPIPFTLAYPVYGGKIMKTSIVNGGGGSNGVGSCICQPGGDQKLLYQSSVGNTILPASFSVNVGDFVYAYYPGSGGTYTTCYYKAVVLAIIEDLFTIQFLIDGTTDFQTLSQLRIFSACSNPDGLDNSAIQTSSDVLYEPNNLFNVDCIYPNNSFIQDIFS
jgi:hypothetical protein